MTIKHKSIRLLVLVGLVFNLTVTPSLAQGMSEPVVKAFLVEHPDAFIFDLRWKGKYEDEGHLHSSILIDSSMTHDSTLSVALSYIGDSSPAETFVLSYCNCAGGSYAGTLTSSLISHGYENSIYLDMSFFYWQDTSFKTYGSDVGSMTSFVDSLTSDEVDSILAERDLTSNPPQGFSTSATAQTASVVIFVGLCFLGWNRRKK